MISKELLKNLPGGLMTETLLENFKKCHFYDNSTQNNDLPEFMVEFSQPDRNVIPEFISKIRHGVWNSVKEKVQRMKDDIDVAYQEFLDEWKNNYKLCLSLGTIDENINFI